MGWHRVKLPGLATRVLTSPIWAVAAGAIRRIWPLVLFGWFAWQTYQRMSILVTYHYPMGIDAQIYYRGVVAWLAGGNPWDAAVVVNGFAYHYAGSPATTVVMAPVALLPEDVFTAAWLILTWAAAVWILRRVHLPTPRSRRLGRGVFWRKEGAGLGGGRCRRWSDGRGHRWCG